jgi:putative oxidoreductase
MELYSTLFVLGRILLGGFFLMNGLNHLFLKRGMLTGYARSKGVPSPTLAVVVTGLMLALGGLGIIFWMYIEISIWLLVIFLFFTSIMMHKFWSESDPQNKMMEMTQFMKNMAIMGALLVIISNYL